LNLEDLRPSFTVYLISSRPESLKSVGEVFSDAGYLCLQFEDLTSAFSEVFSNAPHFIVFNINEDRFDLKQAFGEIHAQLPETHLFLLSPFESRARIAEFYSHGLYDVLWTPPVTAKEWIKALDRATERDYFMYMNEQLKLTAGKGPSTDTRRVLDLHRLLMSRNSVSECIQDFISFGSSILSGSGGDIGGDCGAVYFRFMPMRRLLSATHGCNLEDDWKGLGIDLSQEPDFHAPMLREPQKVSALREMAREVFGRSDFQAVSVDVAKELSGVAIFFGMKPTPEALELLSLSRDVLQTVAGLLELEKRLHSVNTKDETTDVLNRNHFTEKVAAEVMRARRNHHPLSLLLLAVDSYGPTVAVGGDEDGQTLLKVVAKILQKHSRVNDVIGRTGGDEFALLLPDTDREGAAIKAERLRRMFESGDFSKAVRSAPQVTISVGVSEYPGLCRDGDELFQTADEALFQVRSKNNRVCLAKAPEDLIPDFLISKAP
jgi:diguanylate cyclase (GGDEF)-like protein